MFVLKIGLLGAGWIARQMAYTISELVKQNEADIIPLAIAARDLDRAQALADEFGFPRAYGSYEELASDPDIDLIYIATPHSHHYLHAKLCLEHGKHVLCEKAFTTDAAQARELCSYAESHNLLLVEALWTRFQPFRKQMHDLLSSNIIGELTSLSADFSADLRNSVRVVEPALAGGALLDMGIYPIHFAMMVFGDNFSSITGEAFLSEKGIDVRESMIMWWPDGKMATLHSDILSCSTRSAVICGTTGYMEVTSINNPSEIRIYNAAQELVDTYPVPEQISGYEYELLACRDALSNHELECPKMPHALTIKMMEVMETLRKNWGVYYPWENKG